MILKELLKSLSRILIVVLLLSSVAVAADGISLDDLTYDQYVAMLAAAQEPMLLAASATSPASAKKTFEWNDQGDTNDVLVLGTEDCKVTINLKTAANKNYPTVNTSTYVTGFSRASDRTSCTFTVSKDTPVGTKIVVTGKFGSCGDEYTFTITTTKSYTITFDDDGKNASNMPTSPLYTNSAATTEDENKGWATDTLPDDVPKADEYTFVGWKPSLDGRTYDPSESFRVNKDTTFTAVWTKEPITIRYNTGSSGTTIPDKVLEKGTSFNITSVVPENYVEGGKTYTFDHWTCDGNDYPSGYPYTPTSDMIFTAVYKKLEKVHVMLHAEGGTIKRGSTSLNTSHYDVELDPGATFNPSNYTVTYSGRKTYKGWKYSSDDSIASASFVVNNDVSLYAYYSWTGGWFLRYDYNIGDSFKQGPYQDEALKTLMSASDKTTGSSSASGGGYEWELDTSVVSKNQVCYFVDMNGYTARAEFDKWHVYTLNEDTYAKEYDCGMWYPGEAAPTPSSSDYDAMAYGTWKNIQYKYTYTLNPYSGGTGTTQTIWESDPYFFTPMPDGRTGYRFLGWSKTGYTGPLDYSAGEAVVLSKEESSVTLFGIWTDVFTFTLKDNSQGTDTQTYYFKYNVDLYEDADCTTPAKDMDGNRGVKIPNKDGYEFNGYYETDRKGDENNKIFKGRGQYNRGMTNYASDMTFYAAWRAILNFEVTPEGSGTLEKPSNKYDLMPMEYQTANAGTVTATANPHYTFDGWYMDAECSELIINDAGFAASPTGDGDEKKFVPHTYYAKFIPDVYTIDYKDQDDAPFSGTLGPGSPTEHAYGTETPLVSPTKSGYTFVGWYADSACTDPALTKLEANVYPSEGDTITLYAKWQQSKVDATAAITLATSFTDTPDAKTLSIDDLLVNGEAISDEEKLQFAGKPLYMVSITPDNMVIDTMSTVTANKKTWGSTNANSKFAITADNADVAVGQLTTAFNAPITFVLYNANAITDTATVRTVTFTLATEEAVSDTASTIKLTVTIVRTAASINVEVPLYLVMTTNLDGGTARAPENYAIKNNSPTRLELQRIVETTIEKSGMKKAAEGADPDLDEYRVNFSSDSKGANLPVTGEGEDYNPLDSVKVGPLDFVTKPDEAVHFSNIEYTVAIPQDEPPSE